MLRFKIGEDSWDFDEERLMMSEIRMLQKQTGIKMAALDGLIKEGDPEALAAWIWLARRRAGEKLKYAEFDFDFAKLGVFRIDENGNEVAFEDIAEEESPNGNAPLAVVTEINNPTETSSNEESEE